jgi:hypothetical protein
VSARSHPLQDSDQEIDLAPGDVFVGYLDWYAYSTNTVDTVGYATGSGDALAFTDPSYLSSGDLAPGETETASYTITAPNEGGNYTLVWSLGCYAVDGSGCTWNGAAYVTILVNVESNPTPWTTTTSVSCDPSSIPQANSTTCTAVVDSASGDDATGEVDWTTTSSEGEFDSTPCELSSSSCYVTYTDYVVGTWTITASYIGDGNNDPSHGTTSVDVTKSDLATTTTVVSCVPASFNVTGSSTCTATVTGSAPSGVVDWKSTSTDYIFDLGSCSLTTTGDTGTCDSTYTDYMAGSRTITGTYAGDTANLPSSGTTSVDVTTGSGTSTTTVSCSPTSLLVSDTTSCTATVTGSSPTGEVAFTDNPDSGSFDPVQCALSSSACSTTYTPEVEGNITITADYTGDSVNAPSEGSTLVVVTSSAKPSTTAVDCSPNPVVANSSVSVTATVTGNSPTGVIVWASVGADGSFDVDYCDLSGAACSASFYPTAPGHVTITASYTGDTNNDPSSGDCNLVVTSEYQEYDVTFTESGLESGTTWSVTLDGVTLSATVPVGSDASTITFSEVNGDYYYEIPEVTGYDASPSSGYVTVNDAPYNVDIVFTPNEVPPPNVWPVVFIETGLKTGTTWYVTLGWVTQSSITTDNTFDDQQGTIDFAVAEVSGYVADPTDGVVTVDGGPAAVQITFTPLSMGILNVTFTEKGLPRGTAWNVTLGGMTQNVTTMNDSFSVKVGNYSWFAYPQKGYAVAPSAGKLVVSAMPGDRVTLNFTKGSPQAGHQVWFNETGLPIATFWGLSVSGATSFKVTGTGNTSQVTIPAGSYTYQAAPVSGYVASPSSGAFVVSGTKLSVVVSFAKVYGVTFYRPGAGPSGSEWTTYLNSTTPGSMTQAPDVAQNIVIVEITNASTLIVGIPNGTYSYVLITSGYGSQAARGTITVNGSAVVANPPSSSSSSGFFGSSGLLWILLVVFIVVVVAVIVAVLAVRRRKAQRSAGKGGQAPVAGPGGPVQAVAPPPQPAQEPSAAPAPVASPPQPMPQAPQPQAPPGAGMQQGLVPPPQVFAPADFTQPPPQTLSPPVQPPVPPAAPQSPASPAQVQPPPALNPVSVAQQPPVAQQQPVQAPVAPAAPPPPPPVAQTPPPQPVQAPAPAVAPPPPAPAVQTPPAQSAPPVTVVPPPAPAPTPVAVAPPPAREVTSANPVQPAATPPQPSPRKPFCESCGYQMSATAKFCRQCGKKVQT